MSDILERVRKIVIEHLDADPEKVTEKASFIDDLGADSLDNVELVMASKRNSISKSPTTPPNTSRPSATR
jgi:acyl carrier protein